MSVSQILGTSVVILLALPIVFFFPLCFVETPVVPTFRI